MLRRGRNCPPIYADALPRGVGGVGGQNGENERQQRGGTSHEACSGGRGPGGPPPRGRLGPR
jgi:hypothetical protein